MICFVTLRFHLVAIRAIYSSPRRISSPCIVTSSHFVAIYPPPCRISSPFIRRLVASCRTSSSFLRHLVVFRHLLKYGTCQSISPLFIIPTKVSYSEAIVESEIKCKTLCIVLAGISPLKSQMPCRNPVSYACDLTC